MKRVAGEDIHEKFVDVCDRGEWGCAIREHNVVVLGEFPHMFEP